MYSLFFIAKNNIKKHKGEVAILFTLIFLAALLLFSSLSLMLAGQASIEASNEKYHFSDLLVFQPTGLSMEESEKIVASVPGSELVESIPIVNWNANYYYGDKTEADKISYLFYLTDSSVPSYLNALPDICNDLKDDEIVLPYHMKSTVNIGDPFHISANGMQFDFTVKGYLENLYFSTSMNISAYFCAISHNNYQKIADALTKEFVGSFIYCRVQEGVDLDEYDNAVQHAFDKEHTPVTVTRTIMNQGTTAISDIASSIILIFTFILVGLALIIMHFSIKNYIELNIENIGLLQATGYTARSLRFACVLEEMLICVLATLAALGVGLLITAPLNSIQGTLIGLSGFSGICIPALIATLIGIPFMVFLGTLLASRSYKKLTVLESLRSGISNHNFKKNHCPLEKNSLPLNLALSLKQILGRPKKSIFIALIIACLTASTCLGFSLFQNFALEQTSLLKLVGFEAGDIQTTLSKDSTIYQDMQKEDRVLRTLRHRTVQSIEVLHLDKTTTLGIDVYDDLSVLEYEYLLEGHLPQKADEIVLTHVEAENLDATLGDVVNIVNPKGESISYTICGIDQKINNMGRKALMNEEGIKHFDDSFHFDELILYLKDSSISKDFVNELSDRYPECSVLLVDDIIGNVIDTLVGAMKAICFIFVALTCFVVILTEILLTRSQIIRERTELGVSKAIGYTSGELIRRMVMSNLPVVILGVLIGIVMHHFLSDAVMLGGLSMFGIQQTNLTTNPIWFLITLVIIVSCALITSFISSRKISKLEPIRILKEE